MPHLPNLHKLFEQADFKMTPHQFWMLTSILFATGAALPIVVMMPWWLSGIVGPLLACLPITYVWILRKWRLAKFGGQLHEALELVARALRAGHSLAAAMHTVAEECPEPISKEFGRVYEEQNLGLSIEQAMRNLADRVPNLDLKFFVTAVIIQRTTGGDLAEILDKIGYLIRERFKIQGMVKALTGEGRISGIILIALPFGLLVAMMKLNYEYVQLLWTHRLGRMMSAAALVMMIVGALVIRKIVNIKI
jgi:tight adherence protein B